MAAVTLVPFKQMAEDKWQGVHNMGTAALKVALTATAPNATTHAVLADITQISYTNLSSRDLTITTNEGSTGSYTLDCSDLVLTASGTVADWRYFVIYNDTPTSPADPLLYYGDTGATQSMTNGSTRTLQFNASGLFTDNQV